MQPGAPPSTSPPMGASPVTTPTPNKGFEAAGLQKLAVVLKQLESLVPQLGATSEPGAAVLKAISALAKFAPNGSVTPAAEKGQAEQMMMQAIKANQQMQSLKQGAGAPGGAPGGAGGAPPQMPPMTAGAAA